MNNLNYQNNRNQNPNPNRNRNRNPNPRLYNQHFRCRFVDENTGAELHQPVDLNMTIDNFMNIFRHQALNAFQRNPPNAVFLPQLRPSPNIIVDVQLINESNNQVMLRNFEGHGQAILGEYLRTCFNNPNDMDHLVFVVTDQRQHYYENNQNHNHYHNHNQQPIAMAQEQENDQEQAVDQEDDLNWLT